MVFMPHGMDQMFYEPQGSLFPELKGLVAQAVLSTAEGRREYRRRCTMLFTNLFPKLANRVEELRARIRPELASSASEQEGLLTPALIAKQAPHPGPLPRAEREKPGAVLAEHDLAVAALQQRIHYRIAHLQRHLFAPEPELAVLNPGEEMAVTNWLWSIEQRRARMWEEARGQETEDRNRQTSPDERGRNPSPLTPLPAGVGNSEFGAVPSSGLPSAKSGLGQLGGDLRCALFAAEHRASPPPQRTHRLRSVCPAALPPLQPARARSDFSIALF